MLCVYRDTKHMPYGQCTSSVIKEEAATGNNFKVRYTCIAIGGSGGLACEKAVTQFLTLLDMYMLTPSQHKAYLSVQC